MEKSRGSEILGVEKVEENWRVWQNISNFQILFKLKMLFGGSSGVCVVLKTVLEGGVFIVIPLT